MTDRERWLFVIGFFAFVLLLSFADAAYKRRAENCKNILASDIDAPSKAAMVREVCK